MISLVHNASDFADTKLKLNMIECRYQDLTEVMAGCLGYRTLRECLDEEDESLHPLAERLAGAEAIVFNSSLGLERAVQLTAKSEELLAICLESLEREIRVAAPQSDMTIYHRIEDFGADRVAEDMAKALAEDQRIAATLDAAWKDVNVPEMGQPTCQGFWTDDTSFFEAEGAWISADGGTWLITCILEYSKVGRVGFSFCNSAITCRSRDDLAVHLEIRRLDTKVLLPEGGTVSPSLAVVIDPKSGAILGNALSASDDLNQLIQDAVNNACKGPNLLGTPLDDIGSKRVKIEVYNWPDISTKDLFEKKGYPEIVYQPGMPKCGGLEPLLQKISPRLAFNTRGRARMEDIPPVYSLADLTRLVCQNIFTYHNQIHARTGQTPESHWAHIWESLLGRSR